MRRPPWLTDAHITQIRQIISTPREGSGPLLPGRHTVAEALGWTPYRAEAALRYLRSLDADNPEPPEMVLEDGFGNAWERCGPGCRLEVVRPGKAQCDCEEEGGPGSTSHG